MAYNPTDAELAYEVIGPGMVRTRTPSQVAAYRAQLEGDMASANALQSAMSRGNPFAVPTYNATNEFAGDLADSRSRIKALLDNPDSVQQSGAYKWRVGQGMEALQRSLAAKGLLNSGNRLTAMQDYAQGQASQEYENQFNRLAGLYQQGAQGFLGDKNANVGLFNAGATAYNQAQRNNDAAQLGWGELSMKRQMPGATQTSRSVTQTTGNPFDVKYGVY